MGPRPVVHLTDAASQLENDLRDQPVKDHLVGAVTDSRGSIRLEEAVVAQRPDWFKESENLQHGLRTRDRIQRQRQRQGHGRRERRRQPGREGLTRNRDADLVTPPTGNRTIQKLCDAVGATEKQAADRAQSKRKVLGRQRVRAQHWNHAPQPTPTAEGPAPRRRPRQMAPIRPCPTTSIHRSLPPWTTRAKKPPSTGTWHMVQFHAMPVASG